MEPAQQAKSSGPQLLKALLEIGLLTPTSLEEAEARTATGQSIIDTLLATGTLSARDVAMGRSLQLNLPLIDLKRHTVQSAALAMVPESIARRYTAIPLDPTPNTAF